MQLPPSVRPSVRPSVTLSPPKPLDRIQPNLVCELLTLMGHATAHFLAPPPGVLGGVKRSNIIQFQFQRFFDQTVFVFSHMKSDGIFIWPPGSCPRGGTWGTMGCWGVNFFSKFSQIWCVSYFHE